jgi:penicillin-binding protein 2
LRLNILKGLVFFGLTLLAVRLFDTQVFKAGYYRGLSEDNRIRLVPLEAPRGRVFDRAGRLLATNRPAYHLVAVPEDVTPDVYPRLAKLLGVSENEIRKRMDSEREYPFAPILLEPDIPKNLLFKIEEMRPELPGISIQTDGIRSYPYGEVASHLIGYLGKVSPEEYRQGDRARLGLNSLIGRTGIEKLFDDRLRGWRGGRQVEVNARGERLRILAETSPVAGEDLSLTIDLEFQKRLAEIVRGKKATIAFLDLDTHELIALVSSPAFDPNVFVSPAGGEERLEFLRDARAPLLDRGVSAAYPPGSVFKLVTALAALEAGKIMPQTTFNCPGYYRLNGKGRAFRCWRPEGHGQLDLYRALERSCNVYFYNVGRIVGPDLLAEMARRLGLGQTFETELTNLAPGLVPDSAWKKNRMKEKWWPGETLSFAVGQGYLLVSPLQVLRLSAILAKEGEWIEPKLLREKDNLGAAPEKVIAVQSKHLKVIRQGMLKVVHSDYGTGQLARVDFGQIAGKTGTAQAPPQEPHAWMTGFFPYEKPEIAFVALLEHGGSGGIAAARVVKEALQAWKELYVESAPPLV